jgi:hypothetical protein
MRRLILPAIGVAAMVVWAVPAQATTEWKVCRYHSAPSI